MSAGATDGCEEDRRDAVVLSGLARGRALFNRADFWASHEALETAWHIAADAERGFLQGLIQAAASFHKYIVQDNTVGAERLLHRALHRLEAVPDGHRGLDLDAFRAELRRWSYRLADSEPMSGAVTGLPRLEWSTAGDAARMRLESIALHEVDDGARRAVLVAVTADGLCGWGECRLSWGIHGVWAGLVEALVPVLLAEPVAAPSELPERWAGVTANPYAAAGLEAAVWDLWARRRDVSLPSALGIGPRPVALLGRALGTRPDELALEVQRLAAAGYRQVILPARPNADRRILPALVTDGRLPLAMDLGGEYRMADIKALLALDALGSVLVVQPVPSWDLASALRLRQLLTTPLSLGDWTSEAQVQAAQTLGALEVIHLDPGLTGLTEAVRIADLAESRAIGCWVASSAATAIGAASDLALAMHPAMDRPSDLGRACGADGLSAVFPGADGLTAAPSGPGLGTTPLADWLAAVTTRRAVLRA